MPKKIHTLSVSALPDSGKITDKTRTKLQALNDADPKVFLLEEQSTLTEKSYCLAMLLLMKAIQVGGEKICIQHSHPGLHLSRIEGGVEKCYPISEIPQPGDDAAASFKLDDSTVEALITAKALGEQDS